MGTPLLALFERIPNEDAMALAPTAGWIMLFLAACFAIILIIHREVFRRIVLRAEDPRSMALFRIVFGFCAMCNINGLWEIFEYLFTDQGIFLTDVARQVFARDQFRGFGNGLDGDPYGFFSFRAFLEWLKGPKYSLLFFWDSPTAWWTHWTAFQISIVCMIVGFKTRYTKWIAWFLFHSTIQRNNIFWEGTENVYRTFFFYLCLSRCGHAYSVDNWLRRRKLRAQGRLSERGGPGDGAGLAPCDEHPKGLEAIFRRIPAWPRMLLLLQSVGIYTYTGVVKNGSVWWRGDAFYYALNLDHFYRVPPQQLSAVLGTNMFRLNAHVVHFWESLFAFAAVGLFIRFALRERLPSLSGATRTLHAALWAAFGLGCLALCEVLWPVHFKEPAKIAGGFVPWIKEWWTLERVQLWFGIGWILAMILVGWVWHRLHRRPFRFSLRSRKFEINLAGVLKWTTGRRLWISLGIMFHMHAWVLMNIGWFQPGSMSGLIAYVSGTEVALVGVMLGRGLSRIGVIERLLPTWLTAGRDPTPPEDPTLPHLHHDSTRLPLSAIAIVLSLAVSGVLLTYRDFLAYGYVLLGIAAFVLGSMVRAKLSAKSTDVVEIVAHPNQRDSDEPTGFHQVTEPWAYGPIGRALAAMLFIFQVVGTMCWLLPDKDSFKWRTQTHEPFKWWMHTTQTTQGWKMFAPNPPRSNRFLKIVVMDSEGEAWDMKTDVYAPEARPIPWIWYTRQRKINRRISGSEGGHGSWYQKWHARYYCRQWQLDHEGEVPRKVELIEMTYPIPTPEYVAKNGPYDPVERLKKLGKEKVIYTARCKTEVESQPVNVIREREGLGPSEIQIRRWSALRHKEAAWDRWLENKRKKAEKGEDDD